MNYYNQAFQKNVKKDPLFISNLQAAAAGLPGSMPVPGFDVLYFPKNDNNKFGTAHVVPKGFDFAKQVLPIIVQLGKGAPTTGDGSLSDLQAMMRWPGIFNQQNPNTPCLLSSVLQWDIVLIFVQTTEQSNYLSGETDFAYEQAMSYHTIGKPGLILCSLGGFGFLQSIKSYTDAAKYSRAVFVSPGGNGNVGQQFPVAASVGQLECRFFHNSSDPIALVIQSIVVSGAIKALGGISELVEWDNVIKDGKPVHDVTFPLNAFAPHGWLPYNDTDHKLMKGSFIPTEGIYEFLTQPQGIPAPVPFPEKNICGGKIVLDEYVISYSFGINDKGRYTMSGMINNDLIEVIDNS